MSEFNKMDFCISDTQGLPLKSYLDKIKWTVKEMSVEELQGVSCDLYAAISEYHIRGDLKSYTILEFVKSIVDDEIILRRVKYDIQDRFLQRFALWDVPP